MFWGMNSNCISTCLCMSHLWSTHVYRKLHSCDGNSNTEETYIWYKLGMIIKTLTTSRGLKMTVQVTNEYIYIYIHLYWKYLEAYWWYGAISGLLTSSGAAILCNGFCTCLTYHFTTPHESAVTRAYFLSLNRVKLSGTTKVLTWWIILP